MTMDHIGSNEVVGMVGETGSTNTGVRREAGFHILDAWSVGTVVICYSMGSGAVEQVQPIVGSLNRGVESRVMHNMADLVI